MIVAAALAWSAWFAPMLPPTGTSSLQDTSTFRFLGISAGAIPAGDFLGGSAAAGTAALRKGQDGPAGPRVPGHAARLREAGWVSRSG